MTAQILFPIFCSVIIVVSVLAVTTRSVTMSAVYTSILLAGTSGIFFSLRLFSLAAINLVLCAGIVILLVRKPEWRIKTPLPEEKRQTWLRQAIAIIAAAAFAAVTIITIVRFRFAPYSGPAGDTNLPGGFDNFIPSLTNGWLLPLLMISFIIMTAIILIKAVSRDRETLEKKKN
ncbi:MAG: hypothetical protein JXR66_10725 [Bacteroidales bacterium]|nr:hypothetical protein [Bacteroidales bacterium]MBN2634022.1 hypothetical protein [Bacteroidales bacterium]